MNGSNSSDGLVAELVTDYVSYYLCKNGTTTFSTSINDNSSSTKRLKSSIRTLCDEFEYRYDNAFADLCSQLDLEAQRPGQETTTAGTEVSAARTIFLAVVNELFAEGATWSRIVALFALSGALSLACMTNGQRHLVNSIVEWTCIYIKTHLVHWIDDHNGWVNIYIFFYFISH